MGCAYLEDCQGEPSQLMKDNCYVARAASGCWTSGLLDRPGDTGISRALTTYGWEDISSSDILSRSQEAVEGAAC